VKILDSTIRRTRNSEVRLCKVQWSRDGEEEATWESEDSLRREYPYLFSSPSESRGRDSFKWGRFVTSQNSNPGLKP
jgi:hypothetical protein